MIDRDHIVLVNRLKILCCAKYRRFYTYDCCFVSVRRLFSLNTILVRHKTKMSTLKQFSGDIPKEWTLANISPLFQKGDRSLACNYRPVSLTCVPCKLLEHIVCSNIMAHLDEHKLLSDKQHAFRKWHSCETQLVTV